MGIITSYGATAEGTMTFIGASGKLGEIDTISLSRTTGNQIPRLDESPSVGKSSAGESLTFSPDRLFRSGGHE